VTDYEVRHLDDIEEITDGRCPWRPVRHEFGITSFGVNAWIGREAGDRLINEHDEEGEDEELYMVTAGRARFQLGDDTVDAPAGTFVFARPGLTRTAFAEEAGTTLLAIGGRPGEVYEPSGFELWAPIAPLYQESARKTFRKPGPATSTRSTASPRRSRTRSPRRSAISRGGAPSAGASSIAALVE